MVNAKITEVFVSIQGEGIYLGQPQLFIRFAKCNLDCDFCDTIKKGGKNYDIFELLDLISKLNFPDSIHTVSITGGEPLLHTDFLRLFLPYLKKRNFDVYLETNGTLAGELEKIVDLVDVISMDMKLPSAHKRKAFWSKHKDFLNIAKRKKVFVKVVVTAKTLEDEIRKVASIVDDIDFKIPLVLQPVTPARIIKKRAPLNRLLQFQKLAKTVLYDVRVIPQMHKVLGVR